MDDKTVNIYIETVHKGPAKRRTAGAWIVEYTLKTGQPVTRGGILYTDMATENEMALCLIRKAFSIFTKTCCIRVNTSCQHVLNTMQNHWLWQWQKNNWRNAKGKTVSNDELWRECAMLIEQHMTEWTEGSHSYRQNMHYRIRKELEKEHVQGAYGSFQEIIVPGWNTEVRRYERDAGRDKEKV